MSENPPKQNINQEQEPMSLSGESIDEIRANILATQESEPATGSGNSLAEKHEPLLSKIAELTSLYDQILQYRVSQGRGFESSFLANVNESYARSVRFGNTSELDELILRERENLDYLQKTYGPVEAQNNLASTETDFTDKVLEQPAINSSEPTRIEVKEDDEVEAVADDTQPLSQNELAAAVEKLQNGGIGSLPPLKEEKTATEQPTEKKGESSNVGSLKSNELSDTEVLARVVAPYVDSLNIPVIEARANHKDTWRPEQAASERRKALLNSRSQWAPEGVVSEQEIQALSDEAVNAIFDEAIAVRPSLADEAVKSIDWDESKVANESTGAGSSLVEAEKLPPIEPAKEKWYETHAMQVLSVLDDANKLVVAARAKYKGKWDQAAAATARRDALVKTGILYENANNPKTINDEEVNLLFSTAEELRSKGVTAEGEEFTPFETESDKQSNTPEDDSDIYEGSKHIEELTRELAKDIGAVEATVTELLNSKEKKIGLFGARKAALKANGLHGFQNLPFPVIESMFKDAHTRALSWRDAERAAITEDITESVLKSDDAVAAIRKNVEGAKAKFVKENGSAKGFKPGDTVLETIKSLVNSGSLELDDKERLEKLDGFGAYQAWSMIQTESRNRSSGSPSAAESSNAEKQTSVEEADSIKHSEEKSPERLALEKEAYKSIVADLVALESYDFDRLLSDIDENKISMANNPNYKGKASYGKSAEQVLRSIHIGNYGVMDSHGEDTPIVDRSKIVDAINDAKRQRAKIPQREQETPLQEIGRLNEHVRELQANIAEADQNEYQKLRTKIGFAQNRINKLATSISGQENLSPVAAEAEPALAEPETSAQKIRGLEENISKLRQQYGSLPDKNTPEARAIVTEITGFEAQIEAIKSNEDHKGLLARLEEDKAYWQGEIDKIQAEAAANPGARSNPKELLYRAKISRIEDEIFNTAYENATNVLGETTVETGNDAGDERSNLEAKKQELEAKLQELLAADESRQPGERSNPEILKVKGELRGVEDAIAALDAPQTQTAETQDPTSEEYGALYNSLKEEYDALSPEEKNSPEGAQLRNRLNKAHEQMLEPDTPNAETQQTPRLTAEQIRSQVESGRGEALRVAMAEYATLRAENEHKNEGMFSRIGRKKREEALRIAAAKVQEAKMAIEYEVVRLKREQGLYDGDEAAVNAAQSNELFEGLLSLDEEARTETLKIHEERAENRSKFQKFLVKMGGFLSKGSKVSKVAKPVAAGALLGGTKAGLLAVTGATIPVSIGFGLAAGGLTAGIKYGANKHNIDASRAEEVADKNAEGTLKRQLTEEQITKLKAAIEGVTAADLAQRGYNLSGGILQESENYSIGKLKEARGKAAKTMGLFALGAGVTGIAAHFVPGGIGDRLFNHDFNPASGGNDTPTNTHPNEGSNDGRGYDTSGDADGREEPTLKGESFRVESGSGYNRELVQFAKANGHELSPRQADKLHQHLMDKFGHDYIDIKGSGNDVYNQGGDWRLTEAGKARWEDGVTKEAQKWMTNKGLWD